MPDDLSQTVRRHGQDIDVLNGRVDNLDQAVFGDPRHQMVGLVDLREDTQRIIRTVDHATTAIKWLTVTVLTVGLGAIGAIIAG